MRKTKEILIIILAFMMVMLSANFVFAADKITATTTSNGNTIKWEYELDGDSIINLVCTNKLEISGKVEIPSKIDGKNVVKLGKKAFYQCYGLTEVTFPNTLTYIGNSAFEDCSGLKSITIPNSVTYLGEYAFEDCTGVKTIKLSDNLTSLNFGVFAGCSGVTTLVIPDKVTTIFGTANYVGDLGAFRSCSGLKSIVIPENVSTIQPSAFFGVAKDKLTVYGVKESYAEAWARENSYTFETKDKYDPNGITEKIGPKVKSIEVVSPSEGTYKSPQTVQIAVYFNEKITGTTVPTLTIKFGESPERKLTNGVIKDYYWNDDGKGIIYAYNIQDDDEGQLQTVKLEGGTIKDVNGNSAILSCPIISGKAIVANKTGIVKNNTENQDKTNNTAKNNNINNTNKTKNTNKTNNVNNTDPTTATKSLPNTGKDIIIIAVVVITSLLAVVGVIKYNQYKDVK